MQSKGIKLPGLNSDVLMVKGYAHISNAACV